MDFLQSQTLHNLARAFAGEAQARTRYQIYAGIARREGHEQLARLFDETAHNELEHAEQFFAALSREAAEAPVNIRLDAGYPFPQGDTLRNLAFAAEGEREEHETVYPAFAADARQEHYPAVAALFEAIAAVEQTHRQRFELAQRALASGALSRSDRPIVWRCLNCGHIHVAEAPWAVCPICGKGSGWAVPMPDWTPNGPQMPQSLQKNS